MAPSSVEPGKDCIASFKEAVLADASGLFLPPGIWHVGTDYTLPIPLTPAFGALISVDPGKRLTINGVVNAGRQHLFTGEGEVTGTFGQVRLWTSWFGAVADMDVFTEEGTDDGPAINRTINARPLSIGRGQIGIEGGYHKIATTVKIPQGFDVQGEGRYVTFLNCHSDFVGDVVLFDGLGGPFSTLRNIGVTCLKAGSPGRGIVLSPTANGTILDDFYVAGFNTADGGLVLDATDVFVSHFIIENNAFNVRCKGAHTNIEHGTVYGGLVGLVGDNKAMGQCGMTEVSGVRFANQTRSAMVLHDCHDFKVDITASHDDETKYLDSGLTISGASKRITAFFAGTLGKRSPTGIGIRVTDAADGIKISGSCIGWNKGIVIDSTGRVQADCTTN